MSFIPRKLACPSLPTMRWSCTSMPGGLAQALDRFQPFDRRRDHLGERAELLEELLGERLEVDARDGAEQHQLDELVIRQRIAAALEETLAQALAMPVKVRGRLGQPG